MMPDWKPGDLIAEQYELVRLLGRGGMGETWLATQKSESSRPVALKIATGNHPVTARLLEREYNALKGLVHPHLPCVYDYGYVKDGETQAYLAMEYLKGEELSAQALAKPQEDVGEVLVQLCRALAFLHTHGIIHGDLKPQNIVVTSRQPLHVKLIDFGLACTGEEPDNPTLSGTVAYIAPELLVGERPSTASDLYALGVIIFHLVASRFPFEAADEAVTLRKRIEEEAPSVLKYAPRTSVGLSDTVGLLLRRDPRARPGSAREVIALLNAREGRGYAYETVQSRAAYLKSSAYDGYKPAKENLLALVQRAENLSFPTAIVCSEPLMGITTFLNEWSEQAEKSGSLTERFAKDEWKNTPVSPGSTWVVGPVEQVPEELVAAATAAQVKALIVGVEQEENHDPEHIHLPHLEISDLEEMLRAVFGQHHFPSNFSHSLWRATLGYMDAVHEVLGELLNRELIDVGIEGWEWYGVDADWPVSPSLLRLWQNRFQKLNSVSQTALALLAFASGYSLPSPVWKMLAKLPDGDEASVTEMLARRRWISTGEQVKLLSPVQAQAVRANLPTAQVRQVHGLLATMGSLDSEDPAETVAYLGHLILSPSPRIGWSEALAKLRHCIKRGQAWNVRQLSQEAMASMEEKSASWQTVLLILYAESTASAGSLAEARDVALRALETAREAHLSEELAEAYLVLASICERLGEWEETEKQLKQCHEETPNLAGDRKMLLLSSWAWIRFRKGDTEQANRLAQEALSLGSGTPESLGRLRQTLGNLAYFRGDLETAVREWETALQHYEKCSDTRGRSDIHNNLGAVAARRGNRVLAREHWETCKRLSEQTGNLVRVAGLLNNLAIAAFEEGDLRTAEKNYEEGLRVYRRLDAQQERIEILNNLGELNFYRANYPRARAFWNEALSEAEVLGDLETRIEPLVYLGKLFLAIGYREESQGYFEQALKLAQECGSNLGRIHALCELALYHVANSNLPQAAQLLDESEKLLTDEADSLLRWNVLEARLQLLLAAQEKEKAAHLYRSAAAQGESDTPFVARARLGLLGLRQGESNVDKSWLTRTADFPEFAWRVSWYEAQRSHASHNPALTRQQIENAASRLRMIAEQLVDEEQEKYLQTPDVVSFRQWARTAL
jgi:serine/threonine protein kinase/tetratricopeptide (TPR) repeat protein